MATNVNVQSVTLDANGVLTLTGSPTGTGIYTVLKDDGADAPQAITDIQAGNGYALITLRAAVPGDISLPHDGVKFFLQSQQTWIPQTTRDRITLRDELGNGTVWVEEIARGSFT